MTRLEWFEKGFAQEALQLGILSSAVFAQFVYYKAFQLHKDNFDSKRQAIFYISETTKASYSTVYRAIQFFEQK
jgi:hypothetical protein